MAYLFSPRIATTSYTQLSIFISVYIIYVNIFK